MAQIATSLSDRARRAGSVYVGLTDLDLVDEELELGQVVIIEDTSTGDRRLGWVAEVLGARPETVYRMALGPILRRAESKPVARPHPSRYGLQDVETMLEQARTRGLTIPGPRRTRRGFDAEDS